MYLIYETIELLSETFAPEKMSKNNSQEVNKSISDCNF